jgi:hypothetical protein
MVGGWLSPTVGEAAHQANQQEQSTTALVEVMRQHVIAEEAMRQGWGRLR